MPVKCKNIHIKEMENMFGRCKRQRFTADFGEKKMI